MRRHRLKGRDRLLDVGGFQRRFAGSWDEVGRFGGSVLAGRTLTGLHFDDRRNNLGWSGKKSFLLLSESPG